MIGEHSGRMIAGVMPFRAPLIAMTPAFESQNAFWDPVGFVPKRGGGFQTSGAERVGEQTGDVRDNVRFIDMRYGGKGRGRRGSGQDSAGCRRKGHK